MIRIEITRVTTRTWKAQEYALVKETPSSITDKYGETMKTKEYAVIEVDKTQTVNQELLKQEIDDEKLDMAAVIKAINGL